MTLCCSNRVISDLKASFNKLQIEDPETTQTRTVSCGRHLIFAYPEPYDIRNNASTELGKDIDIRGDGGYVIWAGSKTVLGDYAYREGYFPNEKGLQPLPERLRYNRGVGSASKIRLICVV